MDSPSQKLTIMLALSLVVISLASSSARAESELVHEVCSKADDYRSCIAALRLDPRAAKATTPLSFGQIAMQIAANETGRGEKYVERMLSDPKTRSSWKPVLEACKANFHVAAHQFSGASRELLVDRMSTNYDVSMASQEIHACLAFMRDSKQNIPPLVTLCTRAKTYVSIGLVITAKQYRAWD